MSEEKHPLTAWLEASPPWVFIPVASMAGFSTYFCMYAFRKPFTAATFQGMHFLETGVELKTAMVISQILGYALSKYIGIKVCSEARPERRAIVLVLLIGWAEAALLVFTFVPPAGQVVAMFLNGLPLGMIWGLVVWYLEGRRASEILLAALSCSFIVSSGAVKDVGHWLMSAGGVPEAWMPAATGACFLPLFLASVWLLHHLPHPSADDVLARSERRPMTATDRITFLRQFFLGMFLLCAVYFLLTAYRDYRDNFQLEILHALGYDALPAAFSMTELPIGLLVMAAMTTLNLVRDNRRGLLAVFAVMTAGMLLVGVSTLALDWLWISGVTWMLLVGLAAYLAYVPFNSLLFDRLMAATRFAGTAVFAIYVADATGYSGAILLQLYKDFSYASMGRLEFFRDCSYFISVAGAAMLIAAGIYFHGKAVGAAPEPEWPAPVAGTSE